MEDINKFKIIHLTIEEYFLFWTFIVVKTHNKNKLDFLSENVNSVREQTWMFRESG